MIKIGRIELPSFPLLLAPMEDVSDPPFRAVCKELGADLLFTEFVSSEGLIRDAVKSRQKLDIFEYERPVGVQIFGGEISSMVEAAKLVEKVNPDFLDINYGCPVKKVTCKGAGAAILQNPDKMVQMTAEIVKAVQIPVTVKTRLGWDEQSINIPEVALRLQDIGIQALSIHARTRVQMYKGEANWEWIGKVKNHPDMVIPVFGNGDIDSPEKALKMKELYNVDGVMIGRAAIGFPWIFQQIKHFKQTGQHLADPDLAERARICKKHLEFSLQWKNEVLAIVEMRRHYANYFKGIPNFKPIRLMLVTENSPIKVLEILDAIRDGSLKPENEDDSFELEIKEDYSNDCRF